MISKFEKYWHGLFEFGIFIKGFNGIWETISGILFLFWSKTALTRFFYLLARGELLEDPKDLVIGYLAHILQNLSSDVKVFAALYILGHGVLNIFLAVQLYRNKLWAYLATVWLMLIFVAYQIYRVSLHHSWPLLFLTLFDLGFIVITLHEYRYRTSIRES